MSGTDIAYAPIRRRTDIAYAAIRIRACYAMPGADIAYMVHQLRSRSCWRRRSWLRSYSYALRYPPIRIP
eukprot:1961711-Rhodomonas_salina.1